MKNKLTELQKKFVKEYLVDLNAKQAAIRAGYSKKSAKLIGFENLTKPYLQDAIKKEIDKRARRTEIKADDVVAELARISFSNIGDVVEWDEEGNVKIKPSDQLSVDTMASISEFVVNESHSKDGNKNVQRRIKQHDKVRALGDLGKHLGIFLMKHEHTGPGGGPIQVENVDPKDELLTILNQMAERKKTDDGSP